MSTVPLGCCQCCCWGPRWHLCCRPAAETPLAPGWHRCLAEDPARMAAVTAVLGAAAGAASRHVRPPGNPGCHTADLGRRRGRLCRAPVLNTHGLPAPVPACNIRQNMLRRWEDHAGKLRTPSIYVYTLPHMFTEYVCRSRRPTLCEEAATCQGCEVSPLGLGRRLAGIVDPAARQC
jgi:hypothetical protein